MDCHEKGILTHDELGGIDAHFGNAEALLQLIEKIGKREGIGEILADGVKVAAAKIGKDSDKLAQNIKGLEVTGYDLRCLKTAALGFAVSFRGADHNRSGAYAFDISGKVDRLKAEKGRGKLVKDSEDIYALIDSLIICKNARGTLFKELPDMSKLYKLITGYEMTTAGVEPCRRTDKHSCQTNQHPRRIKPQRRHVTVESYEPTNLRRWPRERLRGNPRGT